MATSVVGTIVSGVGWVISQSYRGLRSLVTKKNTPQQRELTAQRTYQKLLALSSSSHSIIEVSYLEYDAHRELSSLKDAN